MHRITHALLVAVALLLMQTAVASDVDDLAAMLEHFLANTDEAEVHDSFWADDLVYTSSSGLRFGKADIMAGFEASESEAEDAAEPATEYAAEEVDIRLFDDMAIVAFKLVSTPTDESSGIDVMYYFNTGTFLKRDGAWKVVAWQATKVPPQ